LWFSSTTFGSPGKERSGHAFLGDAALMIVALMIVALMIVALMIVARLGACPG
jgi:hypothetical protein